MPIKLDAKSSPHFINMLVSAYFVIQSAQQQHGYRQLDTGIQVTVRSDGIPKTDQRVNNGLDVLHGYWKAAAKVVINRVGIMPWLKLLFIPMIEQ